MTGAKRPGVAGGPGSDSDLMNIIPERLTVDEPADEPKKGRNLLVAGALIGVAVAGAAGWFLVSGGTATNGMVAAPTIQADGSPFKVRPANPGGMQVPNQDKLVYERLTPDAQQVGEVEQLLPEPRAPQPPPIEPGAPVDPQTVGAAAPPPPPVDGVSPREAAIAAGGAIPSVTAPAGSQQQAAEEAAPAEQVEAAPAPAPVPTETAAPASPPAPAAPEPTPPAEPAPAAQASPAAPAPAPAEAPPATPAPAARGDFTIQLAALKDEASAMKAWQGLLSSHGDVLNGLSPVVQRADLKDKGIFYRLRATGFPTEAAARKACEDLGKRKVGCLYIGK